MKTRRVGLKVAVVVLAGLLIAGFLYARRMQPQLELGVAYGARVACACRFIGNRSLADCRKDFEPGMEPIRLSEDAQDKSVTSWVPLLASRTVRFDPLLGCQPEPFRGTPLEIRR